MRILFIAEPYMNLHLPIINELEEQGHEVVYIEDKHPEFDWKESWRGIRNRIFRRLKAIINRSYRKYWNKRFSLDNRLEKPFDLLLVINGCSFHPYLLNRLRKIYPDIYTVLYLWDNSAFYDYFHNADHFDKVVTYDMNDAEKYHADLLPFFYTKDMKPSSGLSKYLISTVGSNHSGRLEISRKIYSDLLSKLYDIQRETTGLMATTNLSINANEDKHLLCFRILDKSLPEDEIVTHQMMPLPDVINLIRSSLCILDTDRESQTGTTPRLIWALAMNKKVITTNNNIKKYWFYDPRQILIIDRGNPTVPDEFIFTSLPEDFHQDKITGLRIDNWVKQLIER